MANLHLTFRRGRTRGFTLVEVMMASTILVVGFMGMIQALITGSEMMATARRQTLAAQIMTHEMEKLRLASWTTITGLPTASTTVTIDTLFDSAKTASSATWTLTRSCAYVSNTNSLVREVTFTITWSVKRSGFKNAKTYTRMMSGYYGNNGLNLSYERS